MPELTISDLKQCLPKNMWVKLEEATPLGTKYLEFVWVDFGSRERVKCRCGISIL